MVLHFGGGFPCTETSILCFSAEILDDIKSSVHAAEPTAPSSKESDIYSNDFVEHDSDWEEGIYSPASGSSIVTLSDGGMSLQLMKEKYKIEWIRW